MSKKTIEKKVTPLMQQYKSIKEKHPSAMLLFRVGDFYETFGKDAIECSQILGIVLTKRANGSEQDTELAGFPYHSLNTYLPKLIQAGKRVAVCDQLEEPQKHKKIVKRGVTELVTPGVALNDEILHSKKNNFLASIHFDKQKKIGISFLDISTGEFFISEGSKDYINKLLKTFNPSEVLYQKQKREHLETLSLEKSHPFQLEDWIYKYDYAQEKLLEHFGTQSLKGFGIESLKIAIASAGAILFYLTETQHHKLQHITSIGKIAKDNYISMDEFTIRNLELINSTNINAVTLLDIIDKTISPMGARLMNKWVVLPLKIKDKINRRLEVVNYLVKNNDLLNSMRLQIKHIGDLERLISKVATNKICPREMVQLGKSLQGIEVFEKFQSYITDTPLNIIINNLEDCKKLTQTISKTLKYDAPVNILKGETIAEGISKELDELKKISYSGKEKLDEICQREIKNTGISSLKIAMNNVFGYYIEVKNTHKNKVPENWIRKQTLTSAERYITEELKEYESKIFRAEEKILELEKQLFDQLVIYAIDFIQSIQKNAKLIAQLDCLCSFAFVSKENNYHCPTIDDTHTLDIKQGRHPVIEKQIAIGEEYIANDIFLNRTTQQITMITGPNMSGKSAILRQTALITLMAQIGCFVPAKSAKIGIVDKIFTRVGASDNISHGESTFMVEMNETASILNNVSERSLILLDEIGRGTSTYDGVSIAWAITEFLHQHPSKAKTLFATHYHELNEMTHKFDRIKNYNVSVKELKDNVIFMRKLEAGGSKHSFGIHVAKMAGMPQIVVQKANQVLMHLEKKNASEEMVQKTKNIKQNMQLNIFETHNSPKLENIKNQLNELNIDTLTPLEALIKLTEIKTTLNEND